MGAAALTTAILGGASFLIFGGDTWRAFFHSIQSSSQETYVTLAHPATVSAGQLATKLGASTFIATMVQLAGIVAAACVVLIAARRIGYRAAAGLTLLLSFAASPSAWPHDWPLAAAALTVIAAARPNWPLIIQAMALVFWATPFIPLFGLSTIAAPVIVFVFVVAMSLWVFGK